MIPQEPYHRPSLPLYMKVATILRVNYSIPCILGTLTSSHFTDSLERVKES